jgi:hypothetical protein
MTVFYLLQCNSQCPSCLNRRECRKCDAEKLKLNSDSGDSGNNQCNRGYGEGLVEYASGVNLESDGSPNKF